MASTMGTPDRDPDIVFYHDDGKVEAIWYPRVDGKVDDDVGYCHIDCVTYHGADADDICDPSAFDYNP